MPSPQMDQASPYTDRPIAYRLDHNTCNRLSNQSAGKPILGHSAMYMGTATNWITNEQALRPEINSINDRQGAKA